MSFKDKAREIRDHGAEKRGTYSPEADSAPLRMYERWAKIRPAKVRDRENFCHYWRVVLFWAPLWITLAAIGGAFVRAFNAIESVTERHEKFWLFIAGFIVLVAVTGVSLGGSGAWLAVFHGMLILYFIASAFFGLYALIEYDFANLEKMRKDDFIDAVFIFFPSMLVIAAFKVPYYIGRFIGRRIPSSIWPVVGKVLTYLGIAIAVVLVALAFIYQTTFAFYFLGAVVGFAILGFVLSIVASTLSLHFKDAKAKRTRWETEVIDYGDFQYEKEVKVIEPGRIAKVFIAIGDFINIGIQAIRVNKWKICPIVEIPKVTNESA